MPDSDAVPPGSSRDDRNDADTLRRVFDAVDDMVLVTHRDRGIVYFNDAARVLFPGDPTGKYLLDYLPEQYRLLAEASIRPDVFDQGRWQGDLQVPVNDAVRTFSITAVPVGDDLTSRIYIGVIMRDVTEERDHSRQLAHQIRLDHLTGLPNRLALTEHLERCRTRGPSGGIVTVCFMDLDNLKIINDGIGHSAGDKMLITVAQKLTAPDASLVARFGGDEFVLVYEDIHPEDVLSQVRSMLAALRQEPVTGLASRIDASIGVASGTRERLNPETLLKDADAAMYAAKRAGRSQVVQFDTSMREVVERRFHLEAELRSALSNGGMTIAIQPIVELATNTISATETLSRWPQAEPDEFIPVAEDSGLITQLGLWALDETLRWRSSVVDRTPGHSNLRVGVNVSPKQLHDPAFPEAVLQALDRYDVPPSQLTLELTESAFIEPDEAGRIALHRLHDDGITLAVDDFGSGYSSLGYLQHFPIEVLKLDIELTHALVDDSKTRLIAEAVVALAHSLGIRVVAEGIETDAQLAAVQHLDISCGQGFLLGRPVAPDSMTAILAGLHPSR